MLRVNNQFCFKLWLPAWRLIKLAIWLKLSSFLFVFSTISNTKEVNQVRNESERMLIIFSDIHHDAHCDLMPKDHTVSVEFHKIQNTAFLKERRPCMQHRGTRKHNRAENSNSSCCKWSWGAQEDDFECEMTFCPSLPNSCYAIRIWATKRGKQVYLRPLRFLSIRHTATSASPSNHLPTGQN